MQIIVFFVRNCIYTYFNDGAFVPHVFTIAHIYIYYHIYYGFLWRTLLYNYNFIIVHRINNSKLYIFHFLYMLHVKD